MKYLPDIYKRNIFDINYKKLKDEGIKCLIFDLDNTLAKIDSADIDNKTKELIERLKKEFIILIVSNSPKKRVKVFLDILDIDGYYFALKPSIMSLKRIKDK